jgi:HSP20 family protein
MALVRWEPLRELNTLQHEMNRLFGGFFEQPTGQSGALAPARQWIPAMDLVETDGAYILRADLPGLKRDDVKIELEQNVLTISGERVAKHEQSTDGYYRIERASGSFARSLTLPSGVDADRIEATFADGVLEVRIPTPEQPRPRRVEISTPDGAAAGTVEGTEAATVQDPPAADSSPDLVGATA